MAEAPHPPSSRELAEKCRAPAPDIEKTFQAFNQQVFTDGALLAKAKRFIVVTVAHVAQRPYCVRRHIKEALRPELMEPIWLATEMRAGDAYTHSAVSLAAMDEADRPQDR